MAVEDNLLDGNRHAQERMPVVRKMSWRVFRATAFVLSTTLLTSCTLYTPEPPISQVAVPTTHSTAVLTTPASVQVVTIQTTPREAASGAHQLSGAVVWEDDRCCAGGIAGETIQVQAGFSANSQSAKVTEMRVRTGGLCFTEDELVQSGWEPFISEKSYPFTLPINWVGYYISVQYRDQDGNLSSVYCDDISLEGMPAQTP